MKVELDLSDYATNTTSIDASDVAKKADLANLKSEVYKLDIDKLKNITSNLSHLKKR